MYNNILCVYHSQGLHNLCLQNTHTLALLNSQVQCTRTFPTIHTQTMEYCIISYYRWVYITHTPAHTCSEVQKLSYTHNVVLLVPSTGSELVYTIGDVFSSVQVFRYVVCVMEGGGREGVR